MASRTPAQGGLLAYAEAPEDLAEQIVGGELAGDRRQGALSEAQFFGKEFEFGQLVARRRDALGGVGERAQVAFARDENVLGRMPAGGVQQGLAQQVDTGAGARREMDLRTVGSIAAFGVAADQVNLVVNGDARQRRRQPARRPRGPFPHLRVFCPAWYPAAAPRWRGARC